MTRKPDRWRCQLLCITETLPHLYNNIMTPQKHLRYARPRLMNG